MPFQSDLKPRMSWRPLLIASALWACGATQAAEVVVRITGVGEPVGQVGCALFANATGFPLDSSSARVQWLPADGKSHTCRFTDVPLGSYALAVSHDANGNKRVDTNVVGLPTEAWGVSNNIRPALRAPRFAEAAFTIAADTKEMTLDIKVSR
jgi:uncharacterized protein (DUF2141 family)